MKTIDYMNAMNSKFEATDYRISKLLNVSTAATTRWRSGKGTFDDTTAIRVAQLLELDPAEVVADMHAERAKDEQVRDLWQRMAKQFHRAAAVGGVAVILSLGGGGSGDVQAASLQRFSALHGPAPLVGNVYYVK